MKARRQGPTTLRLLDGVYPPGEDSYLILDCITRERAQLGFVLADIGTGSGILALEVARTAGLVLATDINPMAARCAHCNAELNQLSEKIDVVCSNGLEPIRTSKKFSAIVSNPPYLQEELSVRPRIEDRAWAGGERGTETLLRFFRQAVQHLEPTGSVWMVLSSSSGIDEPLREMERLGCRTQVVGETRLFFERLVVARATKT
ncbi:MAG: tRNA (adenine(22)-N(1))-methyltransferase TrmK [Aigarchaeota archaeon]|nr:tRNA (adenine(22)-N(1))-methyltransferase TrmK [Aigarchaeota archaeon]